MLRRPATSIPLTPDDLAVFEKQYAQGQIYADHHHHHHQRNDMDDGWSNATGNGQAHGFETTPPSSSGGEGEGEAGQMDYADAGAGGRRDGGGGDEKRLKTRQERILGAAGGAAATAASSSAAAAAAAASDGGGVGGARAQQSR